MFLSFVFYVYFLLVDFLTRDLKDYIIRVSSTYLLSPYYWFVHWKKIIRLIVTETRTRNLSGSGALTIFPSQQLTNRPSINHLLFENY